MTFSTQSAFSSPGTAHATGPSATLPGAVRSTLAFTPVTIHDPEAIRQWHLSLMGDVERLWADFTGHGVSVGIYDSGVQYEHWELAPGYDAARHVVVDGKTYDGDFHPASGGHGTAVAGIIAAARNGRDTVGIAHGATITGINIFNPYSEDARLPGIYINAADKTKFFKAMQQAATFDVVNHSWGGRDAYATAFSRTVEGTTARTLTDTIVLAAETGRGGLGTISVSASGNTIVAGQGSLDDQSGSWKSDRHVINVGAYRSSDGSSTFYSTHGAHLLISAPSSEIASFDTSPGVTTTDLLGRAGYNFRAGPGVATDYTDNFGGTSAATPMVTAVVALMLDANAGLGWRDVSAIIAASAKVPVAFTTGQTFATALTDRPSDKIVKGADYILNSASFKLGGGAADWNGGRMHFSTDYGYGALDAYAAVRMAEVWGLFDRAASSSNERSVDTGLLAVSIAPPRNGAITSQTAYNDFIGTPASVAITVADNVLAEHIDLTIGFRSQAFGSGIALSNVRFKVIAPDGTSAFVDTFASKSGFVSTPAQEFTFGLAAFRGVETKGNWQVQFEAFNDRYNSVTTIEGLRLQAYGSAVSTDDVFTYTDEFFVMTAIAGQDAPRGTLADHDGGIDWINAAAVSTNVTLSLLAGQATSFGGGRAFTIDRASRIENAVTGDGADRLLGNADANRLFGMRGDDWLNGGAGDDVLAGGQGADTFWFDTAGASGHDRILDWAAGDRIATSRQLRGADANGVLTVGATALLLLDGIARGDTAELVDEAGATLQALGKANGQWWYGFLTDGVPGFRDGRILELALDRGAAAGDAAARPTSPDHPVIAGADPAFAAQDTGFYLYDATGDAMSSGVQTYA